MPNRFNKATMKTNYNSFVVQPDYDEYGIDEEMEKLLKGPGIAYTN